MIDEPTMFTKCACPGCGHFLKFIKDASCVVCATKLRAVAEEKLGDYVYLPNPEDYPKSLAVARAFRVRYYWPETECAYGHRALLRTDNSRCTGCQSAGVFGRSAPLRPAQLLKKEARRRRDQAAIAGSVTYRAAKPCSVCRDERRYTENNRCVGCALRRAKAQYARRVAKRPD